MQKFSITTVDGKKRGSLTVDARTPAEALAAAKKRVKGKNVVFTIAGRKPL